MRNFSVTFLPKSQKGYAVEYKVQALNQAEAEETAVINMRGEGFSRDNYKSKAQVRSAA